MLCDYFDFRNETKILQYLIFLQKHPKQIKIFKKFNVKNVLDSNISKNRFVYDIIAFYFQNSKTHEKFTQTGLIIK